MPSLCENKPYTKYAFASNQGLRKSSYAKYFFRNSHVALACKIYILFRTYKPSLPTHKAIKVR